MVDIHAIEQGYGTQEILPPPATDVDENDIFAVEESFTPVVQEIEGSGFVRDFLSPLGEQAFGEEAMRPFDEALQGTGMLAIPEAAYGLLKGMAGFADRALTQSILMAYGLGEEAVARIFGGRKGKVDWNQFFDAIQTIGEGRQAQYEYEPSDPGARLALKVLSSVPSGVKIFFDQLAEADKKWGTGNKSVEAAVRTFGDIGELVAFGVVFGGIGGLSPKARYGKTTPARKLPPIAFEKAAEMGKLPPQPGVVFKPPRGYKPKAVGPEVGSERAIDRWTRAKERAEQGQEFYVEPSELTLTPERPLGRLAGKEELIRARDKFLDEVSSNLTNEELSKIAEGTDRAMDAVSETIETGFEMQTLGPPWYEALPSEVVNKTRGFLKKDKGLAKRFKDALGAPVSKLSASELGTGIKDLMTPKEQEVLRKHIGMEPTVPTGRQQTLRVTDEALAGREAEPMLGDTADLFVGEGGPTILPVRSLADALQNLAEAGYAAGLSPGQYMRGAYSILPKDMSPAVRDTVYRYAETLWGKEAAEAAMGRIETGAEVSGPTGFEGLPKALQESVRRSLERDKASERIEEMRELEALEGTEGRVEPSEVSVDVSPAPVARPEPKAPVRRKAPKKKETVPEKVTEEDLSALSELVHRAGGEEIPGGPPAITTTRVKVGETIPEFGEVTKITISKTGKQFVRFKDGKLRSYETVTEHLRKRAAEEQPSVTLDMMGTQKMFEMFMERLNKRRAQKEADLKTLLGRPKVRIIGNVVKRRKRKSGQFAPSIRDIERDVMMEAQELGPSTTRWAGLETATWSFDAMGSKVKDLWYHAVKDAEYLTAVERKVTELWAKRLWSGVPRKSQENIGIFGIAQRKGGVKRLKKMGITKIPKLSPLEKKIYKAVRKKFEEYYIRLNAARIAAGERPFPKERDYFTFAHVLDRMQRLSIDPITVSLNQYAKMRVTAFRYAKPAARTVRRKIKMELNARRIFNAYSRSAIRHIHTAPTTSKLRELLGPFKGKFYHVVDKYTLEGVKAFTDKTKAEQFAKARGDAIVQNRSEWALADTQPRAHRALLHWLDTVVRQPNPIDIAISTQLNPAVNVALRWLNRALTYSLLAFKVRSGAIQPTAMRNAYVTLGEKYTGYGIASIFNPRLRTFASKSSKHLFDRKYDVHATDLLDAITAGRVGTSLKVVGRGGLKFLQFLDFETARAMWNGAYKQAREAYRWDHDAAVKYADDLVIKTQISAARSDISPIQRSVLGRSLTLFQTFTIGDWNFFLRGVLGIRNPRITKVQAAKNFVRYMAATIMINTFYEDVIGIRSPFPTPYRAVKKVIEEGGSRSRILLTALKEIAEPVPIVGGSMRYGTSPLGAVGETIGEAGKIITDYPIKPPWYETASKFTGVPGSGQIIQMKKILKKGGSAMDAFLGRYPERRTRRSHVKGVRGVRKVRGK